MTTMLDAAVYTKEELADLFLQRWNIELDLRSIKDVMQMDVLRCKTPEMVEKEVWMHLLAYNLIRGVMAAAAEAHDEQPRHLSFKGALQTMTAFGEALRRATRYDRDRLVEEMLKAIASHRVGRPIRSGRAAREQATSEAAALSHGAAPSGAQTLAEGRVMANPSAIHL